MKQRGNSIVVILMLVVVVAVIGFLVYQNMQLKEKVPATPAPTATSSSLAPTSLPVSTTPSSKPGWKLYQNDQYKFEFSHPASYKVLTDNESLYGYEKGVLLLYKGGQSYDLVIELWNSEAEYKTKYTDSTTYTVFKTKDGKFITLLNLNKDPEVAEIISTFKFTN